MHDLTLYLLAAKAKLSKAQLAELVIHYVKDQVGPEAARQLRDMLPPPQPTPRTQKRLTVSGRKASKPSLSVVFTSPNPGKTRH